jgi:hypothetical protein
MKTPQYYCIIALAAWSAVSTLTSCNDLLDKDPILETSSATIFSSSSRVESYLEGVYNRLGSELPSYFYTTEMRGDDFEDLVQNGNLIAYEMNVSVSGSSSDWNGLYKAIGEANDFLSQLASAERVVGEDYARFRSEALFVRALSYYYLTVLYARPYILDPDAKAVPLRLGTDETSSNDLAASTIEEVHQQILSDLSDDNLSHLRRGGGSVAGVTHATQAAAHALRMRLRLERHEWQAALREGEAIEGYALGDIAALFASPYYTVESILSFPYSANNKNSLAANFYLANSVALETAYSGIYALPLYSQSQDLRRSLLSYRPNTHWTLTKYSDVSSGTDWIPLFRYAEILLNEAEAYYQLGQEDQALQRLLQVRRRSIAAADDALDEATLVGDNLREAIYNERRLEFVGEGLRSIDIHRRADTFWKRRGGNEIIVAPTDDGYIFPIPLSETSQNSLVTADN